MRKSIDYKETGRKRKAVRNVVAVTWATLLLTFWASSCSNAQKDYESGETTEQIAKNDAKIKSLIDAYDYYYNEIQRRQKNLAALEASGDIRWARAERERIKELVETLEDTEKQIDKAQNKKVELDKYNQEGKVASESDAAGAVGWIRIPPHRTFWETKP